MAGSNWVTYDRAQALQVSSGLQGLLERGLLDPEDQETAKRIQRKLSYRSFGEGKTMIALDDEEYELLMQVEAALWR